MRRLSLLVILVPLTACGDSGTPATSASCTDREIVATLSDYTSTLLGTIGSGNFEGSADIGFGTDPALRISGGQTFFLNRFDGTVLPLDGACGTARSKLVVGGQSWNPQDVACAADGTLWVPFYNHSVLRMLPPGAQNGDPGVVDLDLSAYDTDGNANASSALLADVGGATKVLVSLGRLDDAHYDPFTNPFTPPVGPGLLVRFDAATRAADLQLELQGWNPFGQATLVGDLVLFTMAGRIDAADERTAGLELYDPARNVSRLVLTEADLGGSLSQVAVSGSCGAAIVFGAQPDLNPTSLVTFRLPSSVDGAGSVLARNVVVTPGYHLQGLAWQGDTLYLGDRRQLAAGYAVHSFTRDDSCTLQAGPDTVVPQMPVAFVPTRRVAQ